MATERARVRSPAAAISREGQHRHAYTHTRIGPQDPHLARAHKDPRLRTRSRAPAQLGVVVVDKACDLWPVHMCESKMCESGVESVRDMCVPGVASGCGVFEWEMSHLVSGPGPARSSVCSHRLRNDVGVAPKGYLRSASDEHT